MRYLLFYLMLVFSAVSENAHANAVAIVNATDKTVLQLLSSHVNVTVVNQVGIFTSVQTFYNQLDSAVHVKYGFPMYEDATAVSLRWKIHGVWYTAAFSPEPEDTTLPGTGTDINAELQAYLGDTPLYFEPEDAIEPDSQIVFEVVYVQLLHYAYNTVSLDYPNNYSSIQTTPLDTQSLSVTIFSDRTITGIDMISHPSAITSFTAHDATASLELIGMEANSDYHLEYALDPDELGLFGFSTFLPDNMMYCDSLGNGFMGFIVEPDPNDSVIIKKVFTLIIDRSGSMSGSKMDQAKDAATFIVDNLNFGDDFNIIDFDNDITSLFPDHLPVTVTTQNLAHTYISDLYADGSTNISGSFDMAIPQFSGSDPDVANIIIFMTDGQANQGITGTSEILSHISDLISLYDVDGISINTFGIGADVNYTLLSQIAAENNGIAEFFASGDLLTTVSDFYLSIQNPVLMNTTMTIDPPVVTDTYPTPLPNLYKGHQLVVVGRYKEPTDIAITFTGLKYGDTISYTYNMELADTLIEQNLFLTKLWAIRKIDALMNLYYTLSPGSAEADSLEDFIIGLSFCYSVTSPFTSFVDNSGGWTEAIEFVSGDRHTTLNNYPNPFTDYTRIEFSIVGTITEIVPVVIMDINGRIVKVLTVSLHGPGNYAVEWDGKDENGNAVVDGTYPYYISVKGVVQYGVMIKQ